MTSLLPLVDELSPEDDKVTEITLDSLEGQGMTFGKVAITVFAVLTGSYYEPADKDNFPAVDPVRDKRFLRTK